MFFGLPLRTTNETTDPNGMPLVVSAFQSLATLLALTRRLTSGSTEKLTISAGLPSTTPPGRVTPGPDDALTPTTLPPRGGGEGGGDFLPPRPRPPAGA